MTRPAHDPRSMEQATHEQAMTDVSDVLLNLEHTIARAKKAAKRMGDAPEEHNAKLAISDALIALETARKRLQKDTYYAGGDLRLL